MPTGYTRQSSYTNGDVIDASDTNDEFVQLVAAFHAETGHSHDGSTGNGAIIGILGDAGLLVPLNKLVANSVDNSLDLYVNVSDASVKKLVVSEDSFSPVVTSDMTLGTDSLRFSTAFLDALDTGSLTVSGDVDVAGDLRLTKDTQQPLVLYRDGAGSNNDSVGLSFRLDDSAGNETNYASILGVIEDNTDGAEDGSLDFKVRVNGTLTSVMNLDTSGALSVTGPLELSSTENVQWGSLIAIKGTTASNTLQFFTAGSERLSINSAGSAIFSNAILMANNQSIQMDDSGGASKRILAMGSDDNLRLNLDGTGGTLIYSGGLTALTLDASRNATFSGAIAGTQNNIFRTSSTEVITKQLRPDTTNTYQLGTTGNRWSTVNSVAGNFSGDITAGGSAGIGAAARAGYQLAVTGTTDFALFTNGTDDIGRFTQSSNDFYVDAVKTGGGLIFRTDGATTALTIGSDQSSTFSGDVNVSGTVTATGSAPSFIAGSFINTAATVNKTRYDLNVTSSNAIVLQARTDAGGFLRNLITWSHDGNTQVDQALGVSGDATFNGNVTTEGKISAGSFSEVTIASGAITVTSSTHIIDTEGNAASDTLDTINGGVDGMVLYLRTADNSRDVTISTGTGNILTGGLNASLSSTGNVAQLIYSATDSTWRVV